MTVSMHEDAHVARLTTELSKRSQLRIEARHAMSQAIESLDVGVCVVISIVGVLPALPLGELSEELGELHRIALSVRDGALAHLPAEHSVRAPLETVFKEVHTSHPELHAWLQTAMGESGQAVLQRAALPEEGVQFVSEALQQLQGTNAGEVTALTNLWCEYRGVAHSSQLYHELHTLSHGLGAVLSAAYAIDPILIGLAGWHLYQAVRASTRLTGTLVQLVEVAIEDSAKANVMYDDEVSKTTQHSLASLDSLAVGEIGSADELFPVTKRKRW